MAQGQPICLQVLLTPQCPSNEAWALGGKGNGKGTSRVARLCNSVKGVCMIIGCYTLQLTCDDERHEGFTAGAGDNYVMTHSGRYEYLQDEFAGRNMRECKAQAVKVGWVFKRGRRVFCPYCINRQD